MTAVRFVKSKDTRGIDEGECDPGPTAWRQQRTIVHYCSLMIVIIVRGANMINTVSKLTHKTSLTV